MEWFTNTGNHELGEDRVKLRADFMSSDNMMVWNSKHMSEILAPIIYSSERANLASVNIFLSMSPSNTSS